jgi:hypothetical protein
LVTITTRSDLSSTSNVSALCGRSGDVVVADVPEEHVPAVGPRDDRDVLDVVEPVEAQGMNAEISAVGPYREERPVVTVVVRPEDVWVCTARDEPGRLGEIPVLDVTGLRGAGALAIRRCPIADGGAGRLRRPGASDRREASGTRSVGAGSEQCGAHDSQREQPMPRTIIQLCHRARGRSRRC